MLRERTPYYLAGEAVDANADLIVRHKGEDGPLAKVARAAREAVDAAIAKAVEAREPMGRVPPWQRAQWLEQVAGEISARAEEFARTIALEAGKPIRDARVEVARSAETFVIAAREALFARGEELDLGASPRSQGWRAISRRFPIGVAALISPFNFPLNLVAHKVAPALAAGCPFLLKPASATPLSALALGEILAQLPLPRGAFSILPMGHREAAPLVEDPRIAALSFTGSPDVGWALRARAGSKRVSLELGGNAGCIVDEGADVARAAERLAQGAFGQAGQSCISVQRIFAHRSLYGALREALVERARGLVVGPVLDERTDLGPMIDEGEARRVETWVREAIERGARLLAGGERRGAYHWPTLLEGVPRDVPLCSREVFGPVAILEPFEEFEEALELVNASEFGLQAGVFTTRVDRALLALERLEVGAVVLSDVPTARPDAMPYGGAKRSGLGREGPRYALEFFSELRTLLLPPHAGAP